MFRLCFIIFAAEMTSETRVEGADLLAISGGMVPVHIRMPIICIITSKLSFGVFHFMKNFLKGVSFNL